MSAFQFWTETGICRWSAVWCAWWASGTLSRIMQARRQVQTCSEDPRVYRCPSLCLNKTSHSPGDRPSPWTASASHYLTTIPMMASLVLLMTSIHSIIKRQCKAGVAWQHTQQSINLHSLVLIGWKKEKSVAQNKFSLAENWIWSVYFSDCCVDTKLQINDWN